MSDGFIPSGAILTLPNADPLFPNQTHIFTLIIRKVGENATIGSGIGLDIPNRYAVLTVLVKVGSFEAPKVSLLCAHCSKNPFQLLVDNFSF